MCGIAGLVRPGRRAAELQPAAESMTAAMARRGPDGRGVHVEDGLALAHARLSIIDVSDAGAQPMRDTATGAVLVFNGEIYNYVELRAELQQLGHHFLSASDSEVLLRGYLQWGRAVFERCIGMWALALYDPRRRELLLSRDRFGIKPLFLHLGPQGLVFGSTPSAVLAAPGVPRRVNPRAVQSFLVHRAVDEGAECFFDGLTQAPPGATAIWRIDEPLHALRWERYWDAAAFAEAPPAALPFAESTERFRTLLFDSVRLHTRSDVEVSSCLSGGLDSSTLVSVLATIPEGSDIRKVFSAVFPGRPYDEDRFSAAVATHHRLDRHSVKPERDTFLADIGRVVQAQEEPFGSTGVYVQWKVFEAIHESGIKVAIDGQGADEYLGGYLSFLVPFALDSLARGDLAGAWRAWRSYRDGTVFRHHIWQNLPTLTARLLGRRGATGRSPFAEYLAPDLAASASTAPPMAQPPGPQLPAGRGLKRTLVRYLCRYSLPALLRYEDRNSMYHSIESRVPFLDHRLVEFALSLPANHLMDGRSTKRILRAGVHDLVPEVVYARTDKVGFGNPEAEWVDALRTSGALGDLLAGARAAELVDVPRVRRLLDRGAESGALDHNFLWRVYGLLAWQRWAFG